MNLTVTRSLICTVFKISDIYHLDFFGGGGVISLESNFNFVLSFLISCSRKVKLAVSDSIEELKLGISSVYRSLCVLPEVK